MSHSSFKSSIQSQYFVTLILIYKETEFIFFQKDSKFSSLMKILTQKKINRNIISLTCSTCVCVFISIHAEISLTYNKHPTQQTQIYYAISTIHTYAYKLLIHRIVQTHKQINSQTNKQTDKQTLWDVKIYIEAFEGVTFNIQHSS